MKVLIVKHGALGDVVRTSYFAGPLREKYGAELKLFWITSIGAKPLIVRNPYIDYIVTRFEDIMNDQFDIIFSLDDEDEALAGVDRLRSTRIVGVHFEDGKISYTIDAAPWFDMGLRSRFGKSRADELKKLNRRGHAEIFAEIFDVARARPRFYGDSALETHYQKWLADCTVAIGVNPFAGGRWPSKELRSTELEAFLKVLLGTSSLLSAGACIVLTGAGADREKNLALAQALGDPRMRVADTEASPLHLAAIISQLDYIVSSDSLAMHLGIAQGIPTVAFFSPTSAAEIDGFGRLVKVASTAPDYCSYRKEADNSTITHARLLEGLKELHRLEMRARRRNDAGRQAE